MAVRSVRSTRNCFDSSRGPTDRQHEPSFDRAKDSRGQVPIHLSVGRLALLPSATQHSRPGRSSTITRALEPAATDGINAGVFDALRIEAMAAFDRNIGLELDNVSLDSSLHKPPRRTVRGSA